MANLNHNKPIDRILRLLEEARSVDGDKASFEGMSFDRHVTALMNSVSLDNRLSSRYKRSIVSSALLAHSPSTPLVAASFLAVLAQEESKQLRRKINSFWIRTSVSLSGLEKTHQGRLLGCNYSIRPATLAHRPAEAEIKRRFEGRNGVDRLPNDYANVWIKASGWGSYDAGVRALDVFSVLRGIWNFSANCHSTRSSFGLVHPMSVVICGPLHLMYDSGRGLIADEWLYDPDFVTPARPLDVRGRWPKIRSAEKKLRSKLRGRWCEQAVLNLFGKYIVALDELRTESSFLRLWAVLEAATLTKRMRYSDTIKRASSVYLDSWYVREMLEVLREQRNERVHGGQEIEDSEILAYQLKSVVESVLGFWVGTGSKLQSNEEVARFMDLAASENSLKAKRQLIDSVIRFRGS